jgi:hypothetical protein
LIYKFNIIRITENIKSYLKERSIFTNEEEFRDYVVSCLIFEYELPLNLAKPKYRDVNYPHMKAELLNHYFHGFACVYAHMYSCFCEVLSPNNNIVLGMEIRNNMLYLDIKEDDDY